MHKFTTCDTNIFYQVISIGLVFVFVFFSITRELTFNELTLITNGFFWETLAGCTCI
ncbi:hypothetical protein GIB67_021786, partial [Kingdonia uniflora]